MKFRVDINSDLGEGFGAYEAGNDAEIMPFITSANIACGFHAGDPTTMTRTVNLAKKYNVAVGAHPGYLDVLGFGRREMKLSYEDVKNYITYQIGALYAFAKTADISLQHVKPHGALYNTAAVEKETSKGIVDAVTAFDDRLILLAPPKSVLAEVASDAGLCVANEFFADRAYNKDGSLVSRKDSKAIVKDPQKVLERAIHAVKEKSVRDVNNEIVNLDNVDTICVHGDTEEAVKLVATLKKGLIRAGVEVKPLGKIL